MLAMYAALALVMLDADPAIQEPPVHTRSEANQAHASSVWGPLADLAGYEWDMRRRYIWLEPGRRLAWQQKPTIGDWRNLAIYALQGDRLTVDYTGYGITGVARVETANRVTMTFSEFCTICTMSIEKQDDGFLIATALSSSLITRNTAGWAATPDELTAANTALAVLEASRGQTTTALAVTRTAPSAPIVLSRQTSQPQTLSALPVVQPPRSALQGGNGTSGPIVLAAAPPPPAQMRGAPPAAAGARTNAPSAPTTRETLMQAQVTSRRRQAAIEAEAERVRQAQIAEQRRQAEESRRAQEASNAAGWGEAFGMIGALVGGVAAGNASGGDMTAITAGMAAGSAIVAPNSEIATATNNNFQVERQRYEEQRAFEQQVVAALHDPTNPIVREREAENARRAERVEADRAADDLRERQAREEADREALMAQRETERASADADAENRRREDEQRNEAQRREEERRARDERLAREEQAEREAEQRAAEIEQRRLAAEREQEQERQRRATEEAHRNRLVDFREGVVLCEFTGPQTQFGNWRCEGPLQMTYVNFDRPNSGTNLALACGTNSPPRDLGTAGIYRAFGCGFGIHPNGTGAMRNLPEERGLFVDGRITFRCPISSTNTCRTQ